MKTLSRTLAMGTLIVLLALALSGCVGAVAVPSFSNKPHSGKALARRDASFIAPGKTSRADVVKHLGAGYRESVRVAAMAYPWEMPGGWWGAWVLYPYGGDPNRDIGGGELTRWRALFIAFDSRGVVTRKEFVRLKSKLTLDEQLEKWAGWVPPNTPPEIVP